MKFFITVSTFQCLLKKIASQPFGCTEIRTASVLEEARGEYIRYTWENETDEDDFWELRIEKSDITGDYILIITDHALPEDVESLESIWESNLEQLHHTTGL